MKNESNRRCLTEEQCKRVVIKKCAEGNKDACEIVKKAVKHGKL